MNFGNRRGVQDLSGPRLPANGDSQSPSANPGLEGELDAHVCLLVLQKRDCLSDIVMPRFPWFRKRKTTVSVGNV